MAWETVPACGCRLCTGERPGPDWTDHDRKLMADVDAWAWHVVNIPAADGVPGWSFTVGLCHSFATAELALFGLAPKVSHIGLNDIGEVARAGDPLRAGSRRDDVLEGYEVELRPVDRAWHRALFGYAGWFYPPPGPAFLQVVWPDMSGHFPWEDDFDSKLRRFQPALWTPPAQERPGPWRAWWWASDWPGRSKPAGSSS
ncbi:MAG: DUF4262 domain-containing protein [Acidimicrobiales bacterium]